MITAVNASELTWEMVTNGVEKCMLRSLPGEKRTLIRIGAGWEFPVHAHSVADEVFVVDGVYVDPQVEDGKAFGPGTYLHYPIGTEHHATSPSGCTILVWNANR